jgi:hypothetical protein
MAAGKAAVQQAQQKTENDPPPQTPQCPAGLLRDDAGGEPPGSPATPRGCGGDAGGAHASQSKGGDDLPNVEKASPAGPQRPVRDTVSPPDS